MCNCQVRAVRAILQCRIGDVYADTGCAGNIILCYCVLTEFSIILCYCVLTELSNKAPVNSNAKLPPGKPLEMVWVMNDLGKQFIERSWTECVNVSEL